MKDIYIYGASGLAREFAFIIEEINKATNEWNILGFIDDDPLKLNKIFNGYRVMGDINFINNYPDKVNLVIGVGDPITKKKIISNLTNENITFPVLIHPSALLSDYSQLDEGTVIQAGCSVSINNRLGRHVFLNFNCVIGHDAIIGDYSSIMTNTVISGNVKVGECVYIGTSTTTIQDISIGDCSILGAGAVVINDIPTRCTAVGVPARPIKFNT